MIAPETKVKIVYTPELDPTKRDVEYVEIDGERSGLMISCVYRAGDKLPEPSRKRALLPRDIAMKVFDFERYVRRAGK